MPSKPLLRRTSNFTGPGTAGITVAGWSGERTGLPSTMVSNTCSTLPFLSVLIRNGPNSSPNHSASPIGWIDSMSRSPPVR